MERARAAEKGQAEAERRADDAERRADDAERQAQTEKGQAEAGQKSPRKSTAAEGAEPAPKSRSRRPKGV
jgi:hypothetical protein